MFQAESLGYNPLYLMFPTALSTSFAFMLPVATPPNAVAFAYGRLKVIDMVSSVGSRSEYVTTLANFLVDVRHQKQKYFEKHTHTYRERDTEREPRWFKY